MAPILLLHFFDKRKTIGWTERKSFISYFIFTRVLNLKILRMSEHQLKSGNSICSWFLGATKQWLGAGLQNQGSYVQNH